MKDKNLDVSTNCNYNLYEWDEVKRQSNIAKHGFDFIHADQILKAICILRLDSRI